MPFETALHVLWCCWIAHSVCVVTSLLLLLLLLLLLQGLCRNSLPLSRRVCALPGRAN
jgi:hypothetical protein